MKRFEFDEITMANVALGLSILAVLAAVMQLVLR